MMKALMLQNMISVHRTMMMMNLLLTKDVIRHPAQVDQDHHQSPQVLLLIQGAALGPRQDLQDPDQDRQNEADEDDDDYHYHDATAEIVKRSLCIKVSPDFRTRSVCLIPDFYFNLLDRVL